MKKRFQQFLKKSQKNKKYVKKTNRKYKGGGSGDILTYEQNSFANDPQYEQLATRQMYSEQTVPMLGGKRKNKKSQKSNKSNKQKGGAHYGTSGYFNNLMNGDGGFNTSLLQEQSVIKSIV